ncbi:Hypothetical predicted protein [Paramuricea clavata]|uniref:Uncharacterized protein n=1 Tax=Paramuricea clavata TaxID=317549 RepID=A0A7D9HE19_PARCT|nr:Hypothetical predicted protein [Paramuricea clavata]
MEEFWEMEDDLRDEEKRKMVVCRISKIGGSSVKDNVRNVMSRLMNNELMSTLNMDGHGDKIALRPTALFQIITESVVNNFKSSESEVADCIKRYLKYAPDRKGGERQGKQKAKSLRLNELVTVGEVDSALATEKLKCAKIEMVNKELDKSLSDAKVADQAKTEELCNAWKEVEELTLENKSLKDNVEKLGRDLNFNNGGKKITDVSERQQRRKLSELKTHTEKALWFSKTFGLDIQDVSFVDENGKQHTFSYQSKEKRGYKDLSEEEKQKVKNILFILDKFCIGDASYHELTMLYDGLPRSYLIKQCKDEINKLSHIVRTPGTAPGAQLDFMSELKSIHQGTIDISDPTFKLDIKLSGDGAKMSRLTNFVVISFSILNNKKDVMSSKGNHTLAIIKRHESYDLLKSSCSTIFEQVNKLVESKRIEVNGSSIPVEVYLGGDYKFLLLMMGMKCATSDHACIWCKIHKKDRCDVSKHQNFYWENLTRTTKDIIECSMKNIFSCAFKPLVNIPLCNVVLDELHLMLRVTDKLTKNLVINAVEMDRKANLNKRPMDRSNQNLDALIKTVQSCGVSFDVWEKVEEGGRGGLYDFTSLMGSDKRLLLKELPSKLSSILPDSTSGTIVRLWQEFNEICQLLGVVSPTEEQITNYFDKAVNWVKLFLSLNGKNLGYEPARITPYMHAMVYHVPRFMQMHHGVKKFTGHGVEKLNDDCRRVHLQRSNKWDAPTDVLLVGKRVEHLSNCERITRPYLKRNKNYWESAIKESRSKRIRVSAQINEETEVDINSLTANEIKHKLKDLGVLTKLRSLEKLKKLFRESLTNKENNNI